MVRVTYNYDVYSDILCYVDSACSNQFWEITWVILKYPFLKQADFGQKRVDNLRIIRTLAVGYKREFSRRFESSPTELADLRRLHRLWEMKRPAINAHIADLYNEIQRLEQEIDDLLLEKIQSGG